VIFLYIFLSVLLVVLFLLLIPIRIFMDSNRGILLVEWKNIITANVLLQNEDLLIRLDTFFWKKEFSLMETATNQAPAHSKKKKKISISKKWKFDFRKKLKNILKTIKVKQLYVNIDTDDYLWNAYLYPVFYFLKKEKRNFQINYHGNVEILLEVQSRPIQILYAVLF